MAQQMNPTVDGQEWLVLISQDDRRTMSTRQVQAEVQAGRLARETLVWRAGMSAWASIGSIAELAMQNTRPTVPRARAPLGWDAPLAQTPRPGSGHDEELYSSRPTASSSQLVLELIATGAAVLLIVAITSYTLYSAGAFQAGSAQHDSPEGEPGRTAAGADAKTAAH
jgi:hypothetical protein